MDKSKKEDIRQLPSPGGDHVVDRIPDMYPSILTNYRFPQKLAQQLQNNFSVTKNATLSNGKKSPVAAHAQKRSLAPISPMLLSAHLEKEKLDDKKRYLEKEQILERESHISQKTQTPQLQQHMQNKSNSPAGRLALPQLSQKYATHSQESIMKAIKVYMPFGIPNKEEKERQTKRRLAALKNIKNLNEPSNTINTPLSGSLSIPHFKPLFQYVIDKGNNSQIVRRILSSRDYWTEAPNQFSNYHFRWKPTSNGIKFGEVMFSATKKQMVNHIEGHQEISIKSKLYLNIKTFQKDINKIMPQTLLLGLDSAEIFERDLKLFVDTFFLTEQNTPKLKNVWLLKPDDLNRGQGISVFNTLSQLLLLLLPFGFPESVKIVLGSICSQAVDKLDTKNEDNKESAAASNETKKILTDINEKTQKRAKISMGSNYYPGKVLVLQKYIENPMLIHERKFDIRAWVLVDADYQFYLFKEGYLRLSSEPFSLKAHTLQDKFVHLTNNAIQKTGKNYGKFENGNILSYQDYEAVLKEKALPFTLKETIDQMKSLVRLSFASTRKKLFKKDKKSCFEIFGYDFLLQDDGQVFLIEANTNPCIEESNQLLANLIPRMLKEEFKIETIDYDSNAYIPKKYCFFVDDAFRITLDRVFPAGRGATPCDLSKFALDGYAHTDNLWEIIGAMNITQAGLQISDTANQQPNSLKSPKKTQKLTGSFSAAVIVDHKEESNSSSLPSINANNSKETNLRENNEPNPQNF